MVLDPDCFVFDSQRGWNDAKIDLFYLTVVSAMQISKGSSDADDGKSSFMPSLTNKGS